MNSWIVVRRSGERIEELRAAFSGYKEISVDDVFAFYKRDDRFTEDQIFSGSDNEITLLDGVVLNLSELKKKYKVSDVFSVVRSIREKNQIYFREFIGPFCGFQYDVNTKELIAYANQTGDVPLFYYHKDNTLIISNELNMIVDALKKFAIKYSFDETAAIYMMSFGYMIDDRTFIKEIKRLLPGKYLYHKDGKIEQRIYFNLSFASKEISIEEAVEKVDNAFRIAVKRCFDKDLEYRCPLHLVDASGGLDSRMVNWVAKDMGYSDLFNISYSQSGTDEQRFAGKISSILGNTFIHEQLDDASFIFDLEEIVEMEYGLAPYFAITGGRRLLSSLNMSQFGLEHTGQLGDVILGTFTQKKLPVETRYKRYSDLLNVTVSTEIAAEYQDLEEFLIKTRGFLGMLATHLIRRHYTYAVSPFLDAEFISLCMSIPQELKRNHKLYWAWIDTKYPEAGKIESTRERPKGKIQSLSIRSVRKVSREARKVLHTVGLSKSRVRTNNMNPFQYWFDTNPRIMEYVNNYYSNNISLLDPYPKTQDAARKMMILSNDPDKLLVLTVLATVRRYFGDEANGHAIK